MGNKVTREHVVWCYRVLLGREPESESVVDLFMRAPSPNAVVNSILQSHEFKSNYHAFAAHLVDKWAMIESQHGFLIWVNLADAAISWPIIDGEFEVNETAFVLKHVRKGMTALDIGANIGFFSLLLGKAVGPSGKVIGFEPLPLLHSYAEKSVAANGFAQCQIHQLAVGEERCKMRLLNNPGSTNRGGAFLDFGENHDAHLVATEVEVRPLSDFAEGRVDFIKIDVEGAENFVFKPYRDQLMAHKPAVMSEVSPVQLKKVSGVSSGEYISMFLDIGYDCLDLVSGGRVSAGGVQSLTNVVFLPK
jgi:FkbM family methyltransferase